MLSYQHVQHHLEYNNKEYMLRCHFQEPQYDFQLSASFDEYLQYLFYLFKSAILYHDIRDGA